MNARSRNYAEANSVSTNTPVTTGAQAMHHRDAVDLRKELTGKAKYFETHEMTHSHVNREIGQIAISWSGLIDKRVQSDMLLSNIAHALARCLIKPLVPVLPGARKYLRRLRHKREFTKDRLTVKYSRLLEPDWYLKQYPEAATCRDPVTHYLRHGAAQGHDPSASFNTRGYLRANPDVAESGTNPLIHYIRFGIREGRQSVPTRAFLQLPKTPDVDPTSLPSSIDFGVEPSSDIAVICHVFYSELWTELAAQISHIDHPFDLYVTITDQPAAAKLAEEVRQQYPISRVRIVPNHGRDIYPFVALVNSGVLERYALVCKLHTKRSPHLRCGDTWRRDLVRGILGSPRNVSQILNAFASDQNLGLLVADGHIYKGLTWWIANEARCQELALRVGIDINQHPLEFAGGSIFWVRGSILTRLRGLNLEGISFEPEMGALDGTTAHAIERLFSIFAVASDYKIAERSEIDE